MNNAPVNRFLQSDLETEEVDIKLLSFGFAENPQHRYGFGEWHGSSNSVVARSCWTAGFNHHLVKLLGLKSLSEVLTNLKSNGDKTPDL